MRTGEHLLGGTDVQGVWCNDDLDLALAEAEVLKHVRGEGAREVNASVAFPVSSDNEFSHIFLLFSVVGIINLLIRELEI